MAIVGTEAVRIKQVAKFLNKEVSDIIADAPITMRQLNAALKNVTSYYPELSNTNYQPVEYVQSNGNQYIDSGFTPTSESRILYICDRLESSSTDHYFGVRTGSANKNGFSFYIYNSGWRSGYGAQVGTGMNTPSGRYVIDKNKNITTVNGNFLTMTSEIESFTCDGTAYIFAMNNTGMNPGYGKQRLYSCKMWDDGILVRDFVPCRKTDTGTVGLYDLVNSKFYTPSSGTLTKGPDRQSINEDLDSRLVIFSQFGRASVNYADYVELEYIQGSGTQKINTGLKPTQNTRIVMDTEVTDVGTDPVSSYFFGSIGSNSGGYGFEAYIYSDGTAAQNQLFFTKYSGTYASNPSSLAPGDRITIDLNKNIHSVTKSDGTQVFLHGYSASNFTSRINLYLFSLERWLNPSQPFQGNNKLFSCRVYENGSLLRDFIPSRRRTDGAIGLYDKIDGQFYANAGAGVFLPGEVVAVARKNRYKLVEYVESNGMDYFDTGTKSNENTRVVLETSLTKPVHDRVSLIDSFESGTTGIAMDIEVPGTAGYNLFGRYVRTNNRKYVTLTEDYDKVKINMNKTSYTVTANGSTIYKNTFTKETFSGGSIYLYHSQKWGSDAYYTGKIYSCQIYENGKLIHDFVPCKDEKGIAALYDKIDKRPLYPMLGTNFTAGPEIGENV